MEDAALVREVDRETDPRERGEQPVSRVLARGRRVAATEPIEHLLERDAAHAFHREEHRTRISARQTKLTVKGDYHPDNKAIDVIRFWAGVSELAGATRGEVGLLGSREGDLSALLAGAGLADVHEISIAAHARYENFQDWWNPLTLGIGPTGMYVRTLDDDGRQALRDACRRQFTDPDEPFTLDARAWCAIGRRLSGPA